MLAYHTQNGTTKKAKVQKTQTDTTPKLSAEGIKTIQEIVGMFNWYNAIVRFLASDMILELHSDKDNDG